MSAFKFRFRPRLLDCLKGYNSTQFTADLGAGITVGLVALPLAMAFAIASGLKPESGLFTAIIAGFIISALGGSKVQIGGPAGAFIVIVYGIVQQHGLANLFIATMMAGVLLFIMGLTGLGSLIRFIPIAIVIGFTNGIAMLIAISQIKDFLGLDIATMPAEFFSQLTVLSRRIDTADFPTIALSFSTLGLIILWPRISSMLGQRSNSILAGRARLVSRLPGTVVALVLATLTPACLICLWRPSARASAASRRRFPPLHCRNSTGRPCATCSRPPSPSHCSAPSSRCCAPAWPIRRSMIATIRTRN